MPSRVRLQRIRDVSMRSYFCTVDTYTCYANASSLTSANRSSRWRRQRRRAHGAFRRLPVRAPARFRFRRFAGYLYYQADFPGCFERGRVYRPLTAVLRAISADPRLASSHVDGSGRRWGQREQHLHVVDGREIGVCAADALRRRNPVAGLDVPPELRFVRQLAAFSPSLRPESVALQGAISPSAVRRSGPSLCMIAENVMRVTMKPGVSKSALLMPWSACAAPPLFRSRRPQVISAPCPATPHSS